MPSASTMRRRNRRRRRSYVGLFGSATPSCAGRKIRSIAFPALATGVARLSAEQSAAAILVETVAYLETLPELEEVQIALDPRRADVAEAFYRQIQQYSN